MYKNLILLLLGFTCSICFGQKNPQKKNSTNKDPKTKVIDGQVYTQDDGRTMTPSDQYKILEDDPGNLPRILIGAGLKYDMIHERCFPFKLNAKYRVPDFGEFNFETHKTFTNKEQKLPDALELEHKKYFPTNLLQVETNFIKYIHHKEKKGPTTIGIKELSTYHGALTGDKTNVLVARVPATYSTTTGIRIGGILRQNQAIVKLNSNSFLTNYQQIAGYIGIGQSRGLKIAIDYQNHGPSSESNLVAVYGDVIFAPIQKASALTFQSNPDFIYASENTIPYLAKKIPLGFRVGACYYLFNDKSTSAYHGGIEIGCRPTYESMGNGFYITSTVGITLGFKPKRKVDYWHGDPFSQVGENSTNENKSKSTITQDSKSRENGSQAKRTDFVGNAKYQKRSWLGQLFHGKNAQKKVKNRFG